MAQQFSTASFENSARAIRNDIADLRTLTAMVQSKVDSIDDRIGKLDKNLENLTAEFNKMVEEQKKTANLQRAISELIRVRQEIEQKYGSYTLIRQTMLGVLQATDAALVKKTTISRVSEELMLSTPQYWLAPCLVAVAAWISNDKELAERAIKEAMKRDTEKTAIAMALICRRNGRIETGYEWLSIYFEKQSATSFTEEGFTYIDAYVNGVFGPDTHHSCQGYVAKWIDEVRGKKSNFEASQVEIWKEYCFRFSKDVSNQYPDLAKCVPEYYRINNCLGSIQSLGDIKATFDGIMDAFVNQDAMKKAIDSELVRLVGNYDSSEIDIRKEEEYLSLVKYFGGDEDKAKEEMQNREAKRLRHKLDFIEQMSGEITSGKETTPSKKKTAVTFLGTYINQGAKKYITESKSAFPDEITVNINTWSGKSKDGSELAFLSRDYENCMMLEREREIARAKNMKPRLFFIVGIICCIGAVGCIFLNPVISVPFVVAGIGMIIYSIKAKTKIIERINSSYDKSIPVGKMELERVLNQWSEIKKTVGDFDEDVETKVVAA